MVLNTILLIEKICYHLSMKTTVTSQIEEIVFRLLKENPAGIRWADLNRQINQINPTFHPKTTNGILWKLANKYPDKISRQEGLFRLKDIK